jgi:hypothetical protein
MKINCPVSWKANHMPGVENRGCVVKYPGYLTEQQSKKKSSVSGDYRMGPGPVSKPHKKNRTGVRFQLFHSSLRMVILNFFIFLIRASLEIPRESAAVF